MRYSSEGFEPAAGSPGRATLWAVVVAAAILVTVVLPAEYGIDWTGSGRVLGLTTMGEGKVAAAKAVDTNLAGKAAPAATKESAAESYATESSRVVRSDSVDVTLGPNAEIEYKAILAEGESIVFDWDAGGAEIRFDFHGEPSAGPDGMFLTFKKGSATKSAGSLRAPFTGTHGWYWKNPTMATVAIKLRVSGFHSELKRM